MTPDVNVLVAAFRADHPHHRTAVDWFESAIAASASGGRLTLFPMVVVSFLRLTTNPRVFAAPTPIDAAIAFADALIAIPGAEVALLGAEWPVMRGLCLDRQLRGNALPDAWLAAAVVQHGEHLATFDADFKKLLRRSQLTVLQAT
jgi:toxin-antitoxin system PIN domain toxin